MSVLFTVWVWSFGSVIVAVFKAGRVGKGGAFGTVEE
jgi:hypothetical protein